MRKERHDAAFVVGAVVGGLAAAGVTLFRAPQSGARTRAHIAERLEPVTSKTAELSRTIADQTQAVRSQAVARSEALRATVTRKTRSEDHLANRQTDEFVVVQPLGTSDLEPLPAANAVPPATIDDDTPVEVEIEIDQHESRLNP